ncbi:MAG: 30S ribosomal protein S19e [Thermoplasmata archaeon HGW-Thermoplasmata-1]|nr:MAG: 30S ribosomal protein S19e [Thermoplasmata archaeon HGW-Thermoplasmata-1]
MTTAYDVPADKLIEKLAEKFADIEAVKAPEWAPFVRTGIHTENPPVNEDWWEIRVAAVLRKVYMNGPVGTERLRAEFGGARDRGSKPNKAVRGSGSIVRNALQQLEKAGFIKTIKGTGRQIAPAGQSFVDNAAHEVKQKLVESIPGLAKY